jgi:hypothetical protein
MSTTSTNKKIRGFTLKVEYPNCPKKVGYFEPYTTGEFLKYPEIWQPVYVPEKVASKEVIIL